MRTHNRRLFVEPGYKIFLILVEFCILHLEMDAGFLIVVLYAIMEAYLHANELKDCGGLDLLIKLSLLFVKFVMIELEGYAFQRNIKPCLWIL